MPVYVMMGGSGGGPRREDIIRFGSYPFVETSNDFTPVEWVVLDAPPESLLLISRYILDVVPEDYPLPDETPDAAAKRFMEEIMIPRIFSEKELEQLIPVTHDGKYAMLLDTFLANRYIGVPFLRRAALTDYAIWHGAWTSENKDGDGQPYGIWLMYPGDEPEFKILATDDEGKFRGGNRPVRGIGLRPVIRIDRKAGYMKGKNDPADKWNHILFIDI